MAVNRQSRVRVLIAGPRQLVRKSLVALLTGQPQILIAGSTQEPPPGSADFDILFWDVSGTAPRPLACRFIVLLPDATHARRWLEVGAAGIVLETSSLEEMLDAIRQVARGDVYFPRLLAKSIADTLDSRHSPAHQLVEPLTDREQQVLQLLAQGLSNKEIAQKLYLSVRTVEGHLANIYGKLQVKSRTEAVLWATQRLA